MLCRLPSSSSIRERREVVVTTTALRHCVSTFAMPVRTLDPASVSSSACAPSPSSSSSTGSCRRDLRCRSVTMGTPASAAALRKPPDQDHFTCITGSGFPDPVFHLRRQDTRGICGYIKVRESSHMICVQTTAYPNRYLAALRDGRRDFVGARIVYFKRN